MSNQITDADFDAQVLQSDLPVLVDFWAPWCGPCKAMGPIIDELEQEYAGKLKVMKMNVDENIDVPSNYNIMSIPTFIVFKDGKIATQFIGARPKAAMKQELDTIAA